MGRGGIAAAAAALLLAPSSAALTLPQQQAIALIPKVTGVLSMLGSACIICMIKRDEWKHPRVYNRLLLVMSGLDLTTSFWFAMSSWPIPAGSPDIYDAAGNIASCSAQGFFLQLGIAVPAYNALLAINALLTIRYRFSEIDMRNIEPYMHALGLGFPLVTALVALGLGLYNNANLWCWINALPIGCDRDLDTPCERGDHAWIFQWAFFFAPLWGFILAVLFAMGLVYLAVHDQEQAISRFKTAGGGSSHAVATQAVLYVSAFYVTWVFGTANRVYQIATGKSEFTLILLHAVFVPMQGLLNFLVFLRPRFLKQRRENTEMSICAALWQLARECANGVPAPAPAVSEVRESSVVHPRVAKRGPPRPPVVPREGPPGEAPLPLANEVQVDAAVTLS